MKKHNNNPRNRKYLVIRDGYEIEVLVSEDILFTYSYQVFANYKGFERHNVVYISNDLKEGVEGAIKCIFEDFTFEEIIYHY